MTDLLPCPFCGGPAVLSGSDWYYVECVDECGVDMTVLETKEQAVDKWNTRNQWQPIETAPKKQGPSMLFVRDGWITVGCWNKHRERWCCDSPGYPNYSSDETPAHWQPLPEPPEDG